MTRNPLLNAAAAFTYITVIAAVLRYGLSGRDIGLLTPVTALCLLVLSVLVMGYTLLLEPILSCFEGEPRAGAALFIRTLATFAVIAVSLIAVYLLLR